MGFAKELTWTHNPKGKYGQGPLFATDFFENTLTK